MWKLLKETGKALWFIIQTIRQYVEGPDDEIECVTQEELYARNGLTPLGKRYVETMQAYNRLPKHVREQEEEAWIGAFFRAQEIPREEENETIYEKPQE